MRRFIGLLGLAALAAGCATTPSPPPVENPAATWQARQAELTPLTSWNIHGRLAMRSAEEGWQASVLWVRTGVRHRIDITGPLGRGHLRLIQNSHGAELQDAEHHIWRAENAEQLLYRITGWRLPLDGLNYWVLGLPLPGMTSSQELDAQGRLHLLTQSGWEVRFLEYTRYGSLDLPSKLFIKKLNDGAAADLTEGGELEVRLLIENWAMD